LPIILAEFLILLGAYYSQSYASIIGQGLVAGTPALKQEATPTSVTKLPTHVGAYQVGVLTNWMWLL